MRRLEWVVELGRVGRAGLSLVFEESRTVCVGGWWKTEGFMVWTDLKALRSDEGRRF